MQKNVAISLLWHQRNYPCAESSLTSAILQMSGCLKRHTFYSWRSSSFVYVQICQWLLLHYYTLSEAPPELYITCYITMNYALVCRMSPWISQVGGLQQTNANGHICRCLLTAVHFVVIIDCDVVLSPRGTHAQTWTSAITHQRPWSHLNGISGMDCFAPSSMQFNSSSILSNLFALANILYPLKTRQYW